MNLSPSEVELFYRVWFSLLLYTNRELQIFDDLKEPSQPRALSISPEDAAQLRDALWEEEKLLDRFIAENPHKLSSDDLALASSWHTRRSGPFFIFRCLKKYTIFLDDNHAYGVLGLIDPLEDILGPYLPIMVETTLLPLGNKIIYDGLLSTYSVYFGGGIRADLKVQYQDAKELGGVITQLGELDPAETARRVGASNALVLKAFQKQLYADGLSPATVERHMTVLNLYAADFRPAQLIRRATSDDVQAFLTDWLPQHSPGKLQKPDTSLKRFIRFLRDTGRMDWPEAEAILKRL
jgi:hypothetical protein